MSSRLAAHFVSGDLVARTDPARVRQCGSQFLGAVLFVDIEGYTDLTERLTRSGPEGIERLSRLLNDAFGHYVRTVEASGGCVALFAGDALLAYWPATDSPRLPAAVAAARSCADRLRDDRPVPAVPRDRFAPRLRLGLGAGELWAARVGPEDAPEILLAGAAVREATLAKGRAPAGELVIGPTALASLAPSPSGPTYASLAGSSVAGDAGHARLGEGLAGLDAAALAPFVRAVPPGARDGSAAIAEKWLAERRRVVPLFVGFDGIDPHAPKSIPRIDALARRIRAAVEPVAGPGGQLLVDDCGLVFLVVLGLPRASRGQEELRAVQLALELRAAARAEGLRARVGIARGPAFTGVIGNSDSRCSYVTVGGPMNIAARLMAAAHGDEILCPLDLASRAPGASCSSRAEMSLKGVERPVEVVAVDGISSAETPVAGRARELEWLRESIDLSRAADTGALIVVRGAAGVGKTSLLRGLTKSLRSDDVVTLGGGAGTLGGLSGYAALAPLLRSAFGIALGASSDEVAGQLEHHFEVNPDQRKWAPLLNAVFPLRLDEGEATRSLRGRERAEATQRLLEGACRAVLAGGSVVVIEDLQWFDSASARLLSQLIRRAAGVVFVATSRDAIDRLGDFELANLGSSCLEIELSSLDLDGVGELLRGLTDGEPIDPRLVDELHARTAGHPHLVRQRWLALVRRGELARGEQGWNAATRLDSLDEDLAADAQGLVSSRLDGLGAAAQIVLKVASVIGNSFDRELLARALPRPEGESGLDAELRELIDAKLIEADGDGAFSFEHAVVREVAYELLLFEQRRGVHGLVARELESGSRLAKPGEIFRHYDAAGDQVHGLRWADIAANEAADAGAWREAIVLLRRCLEVAEAATAEDVAPREEATTRRIRWFRQLSEAHGNLGHTGERRTAAHAALALARSSRFAWLTRLPVWSRVLIRGAGGRLRLAPPGETSAPALAGAAQLSRAHAQAALVAYFDSNIGGMIRQTLQAIDHAERAGLAGDLARHYASLGGILGVAGAHRLGTRHLRRAAEIAESAADVASLVFVHLVQALYSVGRGDWESAEASAQAGQELAEALSLPSEWGNIQVVRFWSSVYRGRLDEAETRALALLQRSRDSGHEQHESWGLRSQAVVYLERGRADLAEPLLRRSLVVPERDGAAGERLESLGSLALAQWRLGRRDDARETVEGLVALADAMGRPTSHAQTMAVGNAARVTAEAVVSGLEGWARLHARVMKMLARTARAFPIAAPTLALLRGRDAERSHAHARARRQLALAYRRARELGLSLAELRQEGAERDAPVDE